MRRRSPTGFTLLEIVIALGIFAILSVVVIDVFFSSGREERRGVVRSQATSSTRFAIELMAQDARLGTPDYEFYSTEGIALVDGLGNVKPVHVLALVLPDHSRRIYQCSYQGDTTPYDNCPGVGSMNHGQLQRSFTGSNWESVTIEDAALTNFSVIIAPEVDPLAFTATVDEQPTVTISLTTVGVGEVESSVQSHFQTTVTTRRYER